MSAPLLLDLSHTSHTRARTGIQRVARSLQTALGDKAVAITFDPFLSAWRELEPWETANLRADAVASKRGADWPLAAKLRSRTRRVLGGAAPKLPANAGLIVPEVFSPEVARAFPSAFAAAGGPRVAWFHDAIALKFPELTPPRTVARFPAYLVELLQFDGIAAVSEDSRRALIDYWQWLGLKQTPPVEKISLGIEPHELAPSGEKSPPPTSSDEAPIVLSVGSIEGRKNHIALLEACEKLWARGERFSLHLVGLAQPQTGATALKRLRELQQAGRPLRYDGAVNDHALGAAYRACAFTVYPSLMEGFGLPVIESLSYGKPCICSGRGALGESARDGGCVMLDAMTPTAMADAIAQLLAQPEKRAALADQARARRLISWRDCARELTEWLRTLTRR